MRVRVYVSFPGDDDLAGLPYHLKDFLIVNPNQSSFTRVKDYVAFYSILASTHVIAFK